MLPLDPLVARIRGEYQEMPGLRLTFAQACRLWQLDAATCHAVLHQLMGDRFLHQTPDGAYVAFSSLRLKAAKAVLSSEAHAYRRARA
jgi:hypothetical protein